MKGCLVNAEIHTATAPLTSLTCCKNYIILKNFLKNFEKLEKLRL